MADAFARPAPHPGSHVDDVGPSHAHQHDRRLVREIAYVLQQIQQRRFGPLDVVDHRHDGRVPRRALEQLADRPVDLLGGSLRILGPETEHAEQPGRHQRTVVRIGDRSFDLLPDLAGGVVLARPDHLRHDLGGGEEGDPRAVAQTPPAQDRGAWGDELGERIDQAGLAHPRLTDHGDHPASTLIDGAFARLHQLGKLLRAPHQRLFRPPSDALTRGIDGDQTERGERLRLPFERQRLDGFDVDRVSDQSQRRAGEQDLTGRGYLLQPGGHVDRVAAHEGLACPRIACHHLAGVDPGADHEPHSVLTFEVLVETCERFSDPVGGSHRAHRVVLVDDRHAEHGHDGISDELLDGATVELDHRMTRVEVLPHHSAHGLGIQRVAHRRGTNHIGEEDRHGLPDLEPVVLGNLGAARHAEARLRRAVRAAGGTTHHATLRSRPLAS